MKWIWLAGLLGVSVDAYAGCETDHDCKGDRVCNDGACEEPLSRPESSAPSPTPSSTTIDVEQARSLVQKTRRGAAATAVLGLASAATNGETFPALPLGAAALISAGVTVPKSHQAGALVGKPDMTLLGVAAYTLHGLSMINGSFLVGVGIADETAPTAAILSCTILGTSAGILMANDANQKIDAASAQ